jgi:hypothetical protein
MQKVLGITATLIVTLATPAAPARAQFGGYVGHGPYAGGWGGYGWGWAASTPEGDIARGLGQFAVGAGVYNELTARAEAAHAETLWRTDQYAYLSRREANRIYRERIRARRDRISQAREETYRRLSDHPTLRDIDSGDALNVALDLLRDPRVSLHVLKILKGGRARLRGPLVRELPFHYAPAAITFTVDQVLRDGPPAVLRGGAFAAERDALAAFTAGVRKELEEREELRPETIARGLDLIRATQVKVEDALPARTAARRAAGTYLESLSILCRLLGTPAADIVLAGADGRPETRLGELLEVMSLHGLRFGVASTPRQRLAYARFYPLLASWRDEVRPAIAPPAPAAEERTDSARALPVRAGRQSVWR